MQQKQFAHVDLLSQLLSFLDQDVNFCLFLLKCTKMRNDVTTQSCDAVQRKAPWSSDKSCNESPPLITRAVVYKADGNFCVWMAFNHTKTHICRRPHLLIETLYLQTNKLLKKKTSALKCVSLETILKPSPAIIFKKQVKSLPTPHILKIPLSQEQRLTGTKLFVRAVLLALSHTVSASGCFVGRGIPLFCTGKALLL